MNFNRKSHHSLTFDYETERDYMNSKLADEDIVVKIIDYLVNPTVLRKSYTIVKGLQNNFKKIAGNPVMLSKIQAKLRELSSYSYDFSINNYTN